VKKAFFLILFLFSACSDKGNSFIDSFEPNNTFDTATMITADGTEIAASLKRENGKEEDVDVYFFEAMPGYLYRFQSSGAEYSRLSFLFESYAGDIKRFFLLPKKDGAGEFYSLTGQYIYLSVTKGEASSDKSEKYAFSIKAMPLCSKSVSAQLFGESQERVELNSEKSYLACSSFEPEESGFYGIALSNLSFDGRLVAVGCDTNEVISYSDDLDSESDKKNPYIYAKFLSSRRYQICADSWITLFGEPWDALLSLKKQKNNLELEPNDHMRYGNYFDNEIAGVFSLEDNGEKKAKDSDWFKHYEKGGTVVVVGTEIESSEASDITLAAVFHNV